MSLIASSLRRVMGLAVCAGVATDLGALEITFDTSHDTNNFFAQGTQARTVLDAAGGFFESLLQDDLGAINPNPGAGNTWQSIYTNPQTGGPVFGLNPSIAADTLVVYVGARDLGGALGHAAPGGILTQTGDAAWLATLASRGEGSGDFGPWGGHVSVANNVTWDYSLVGGTPGQYNLYSNLVHELGHVFGIGTAQSWMDKVNSVSDQFTGPLAVAEFGGNVPLHVDEGHWADGTTSRVVGSGTPSEASMDPTLAAGAFKPFTDLDAAGLGDIGWQISAMPVPEPSAAVLLAAGLSLFARRRRGSSRSGV